MADRFTRAHWSLVLTAGMALIVVVLAVVQYQWSVQVSEAEGQRMRRGLGNSVRQFREDFNRELRRLGGSFQPGRPFREDWSVYADRLDEWRQRSAYPGLVRTVFFAGPGDAAGRPYLALTPIPVSSKAWIGLHTLTFCGESCPCRRVIPTSVPPSVHLVGQSFTMPRRSFLALTISRTQATPGRAGAAASFRASSLSNWTANF